MLVLFYATLALHAIAAVDVSACSISRPALLLAVPHPLFQVHREVRTVWQRANLLAQPIR